MSGPMLLTAAAAAKELGVSEKVFREDIAPVLKAVPVRSNLRYPKSELVKWVDRNAKAL